MEAKTVKGLSFEQWQERVDRFLLADCGLDHNDLPDCDYWTMWFDGVSPSVASRTALALAQ